MQEKVVRGIRNYTYYIQDGKLRGRLKDGPLLEPVYTVVMNHRCWYILDRVDADGDIIRFMWHGKQRCGRAMRAIDIKNRASMVACDCGISVPSKLLTVFRMLEDC